MKSRRAVSPVIATVILVAVAITITIAVAYWMGGIAGGYTKFEKVEIQSMVCSKDSSDPPQYWVIEVVLKNSGSAVSTLNGLYINDRPVDIQNYNKDYSKEDEHTSGAVTTSMKATAQSPQQTIDIGQSVPIKIWIAMDYPSSSAPYTSGTMVNIKFHSAGGMDYVKVIELV